MLSDEKRKEIVDAEAKQRIAENNSGIQFDRNAAFRFMVSGEVRLIEAVLAVLAATQSPLSPTWGVETVGGKPLSRVLTERDAENVELRAKYAELVEAVNKYNTDLCWRCRATESGVEFSTTKPRVGWFATPVEAMLAAKRAEVKDG